MPQETLRRITLPVLLAAGFVMLDFAVDRFFGGPGDFGWSHAILVTSVLLVSFALLDRAQNSRAQAEAVLRQARDEMAERVRKRTEELARALEELQIEVAERKQAEETARRATWQAETEKRHLEAVLQALPVGVVITDAQGAVLLSNRMDEKIWGPRPSTRSVDDYGQYRAWWVHSGKPVQPHEWASARAVTQGVSVYGQLLEIERFGGEHVFVLNSAVPIRDGEGKITGSVVAVEDITELRRAEQALRESEQKYSAVFDNSPFAATLIRFSDSKLVNVNDSFLELFECSREEALGRTAVDLGIAEPEARAQVYAQLHALGSVRDLEAIRTIGSGAQRVLAINLDWVDIGVEKHVLATIRDITQQRQAEQALRESEEKYRLLFQNMSEGFALYELLYDEQGKPHDWRVLEVNDAYERHTGVPRDRIAGRRGGELFPVAIPEYLPLFARVVQNQESLRFETYAQAVGRHQRVTTFPIGDNRFASIIEDISERKRAEAELALSAQERAALEERQRLARDLHDSVSQELYGISLGVHSALNSLDTDPEKVREALDFALSRAHAGLMEMRALIFELRPEALENEGLVVALSRQAEQLSARRRVEIHLALGDEPDVPLATKEALYRIAQEAMVNAVKHSRSDRLEVSLDCRLDGCCLEVSDNGIGFDPRAAFPGHLGLRTMRERAQAAGGKLEITSTGNAGTRIRVCLPGPESSS